MTSASPPVVAQAAAPPRREDQPIQRVLVIVNPTASQGRADLQPAIEYLRARRTEVICHEAASPGDTDMVIRQEGRTADLVIIAGGDGTVHRALPALLALDVRVGILPMGTGNDLARTLGLPLDLEAAVRVASAGRIRRVDVGRVNDRPFINVASIGLSVEVARKLTDDSSWKRRLGILSYPLAVLDRAGEMKRFSARVECDDHVIRTRALQLWVANGSSCGGGHVTHVDALIDDGRLDVLRVPATSVGRLVRMLPAILRPSSRPKAPTSLRRGRRISIDTARPMPINADGEVIATTPARFDLMDRALAVMVADEASR